MTKTHIPIVEAYRGVGIHDHQSLQRIEVVKRAIDEVFATQDLIGLENYAGDVLNPPEARIFAVAKVKAVYQLKVESREKRPILNLARLEAIAAGLDNQGWRSPTHYGCLVEEDGVEREQPLPDDFDK